MIYLDSAATSFYRPPEVAEAVAEAIRTVGNCGRGTYEPALSGARIIFETRQLLAELFHVEGPEQVAFTANSTESLNMAIKGIVRPGDRVVSTVLEHNSVLRPLYEMEARGASLTLVGCLRDEDGSPAGRQPDSRQEAADGGSLPGGSVSGRLDYEALRRAITPGTRAVVVTHASNLTGNVTDIRRVGAWCRQAGAIFIVDASQTAGIFPIDMEADSIDILCFTGHKGLMGPQGTGGICVRKGLDIAPLLSGGSGIMTYSKTHPAVMPTALEAGTLNGHGIAGLKAALLYIKKQGLSKLRGREQEVMRHFYSRIREIPNVRIYGDFTQEERAAIVSFNLGSEDSGQVSAWLAEEYSIFTRSGGHCAPLMHEALGTREQGAVRASFSHFNTMEEADMAAEAVRQIAREV